MAALYAAEDGECIIVINDEIKSSFIELNPDYGDIYYLNESRFTIRDIFYLFLLNSSYRYGVLVEFINDDVSETEFDLNNDTFTTGKSIVSTINNISSINAFTLGYLDSELINGRFLYFSNVIRNLKDAERNIFFGVSNLDEVQIVERYDDCARKVLDLKELKILKDIYSSENFRNENKLESYISEKIINLEEFTNNNFDRFDELYEVSSYPCVFKYFSCYLALCAEESFLNSNTSTAFILYFRALEVYCDGALIAIDEAKIDYKGDKKKFLLKKSNGSYFSPAGFGPKWGKILENINISDSMADQVNAIGDLKDVRNIHLYTHGDLIVNSKLYLDLVKNVDLLISAMDDYLSQSMFMWEDVYKKLKSLFVYDVSNKVSQLVISDLKFNIQKISHDSK
ncbi:hypothetical protein LZS94_07370 [Aliivibrio fischeri]|uniref:hypothetical protein n=1 Tax=Aliivibrio fischeri TaxID=668 RepID=UPI001F202B84|nr:hypothetical protein [Aliivibrio fischeri]MCE7577307.1 hypothetical protein [Aliivibrio fischeri]MCE7589596.1 hypothetical protein [Aliivibrio fischeri]